MNRLVPSGMSVDSGLAREDLVLILSQFSIHTTFRLAKFDKRHGLSRKQQCKDANQHERNR